jgi:hypothetical protein
VLRFTHREIVGSPVEPNLMLLALVAWSLLICAPISTAQAEPVSDDASPRTMEALKDSVVDRLAECETHGRPDAGSVVVIDTNNEASIGKLQFQAKTVVHYTKLIEGRSIDRKQAVEIALHSEQAASLAKRIIFEKDGLSNWHVCSKKLGLMPEVKLIQWMMK